MGIPGAQLAGQLARAGLDGVALDLQHGLIGMDQANGMAAAITAAGKPVITRVLWNDPGLIGQALDFGSSVVIAPMVNSVDQAKALVKAAKYPPVGQRSWGGYAMVQASGKSAAEYLKEANRDTLVFAMVETQEALDLVEQIAAVPGLDGLFVGPSDLVDCAFKWCGIEPRLCCQLGGDEEGCGSGQEKRAGGRCFCGHGRNHQAICRDGLHLHGRGDRQ